MFFSCSTDVDTVHELSMSSGLGANRLLFRAATRAYVPTCRRVTLSEHNPGQQSADDTITAALGFYAMHGIKQDGDLDTKTFDGSLMSINYARAAATDFYKMRALASRRLGTKDLLARTALEKEIENLENLSMTI